MKQQIRLTESELQNIIEESVRRVIAENMEDESKVGDWLSDKIAGFGNSFSRKDVGRTKAAAKNLGANFGDLSNIGNLYANTKEKLRKDFSNRKKAFGAGVNASKNQRYVQNAVDALQQLQQMTTFKGDPTFGPNSATGKSVAQTLKMLVGYIKGRINSDATTYRNDIYR